jgi:hypothetical protein
MGVLADLKGLYPQGEAPGRPTCDLGFQARLRLDIQISGARPLDVS